MGNKFTDKLFGHVDEFFKENKDQELKARLAKQIKSKIFTEDILNKLNEADFTGFVDEDNVIIELFDSIFPIVIRKDAVRFKLYRHKIQVEYSDNIDDRYIYMLADGRFTSGNLKCYTLADQEYVDNISKIIEAIPSLKQELINTLKEFQTNMEEKNYNTSHVQDKASAIQANYELLLNKIKS